MGVLKGDSRSLDCSSFWALSPEELGTSDSSQGPGWIGCPELVFYSFSRSRV